MEELIIDKKKIFKYLIIIILILVGIRVYFGYQKEDFFMDETFSYTLMNMKEGAGMIQTAPEFNNIWISGDKIKNMLVVSKDEVLRYDTVYYNQTQDVHPPLYYFLLHTASALSFGNFTKWTGIILNILIFIGISFTLYVIGKKVFKSTIWAIVLVAIYGVSAGAIFSTIFIRMYELLILFVLLYLNKVIDILKKNIIDKEDITKKDMLELVTIFVLGMLTHYHFIIISVLISLVLFIIMLFKKVKISRICTYVGINILGLLIYSAIYPSFYTHMFGTQRGTESTGNLLNLADYADRIKRGITVFDVNIFGEVGKIIIPIFILFITLAAIKKTLENGLKKVEEKDGKKEETECIDKYILGIVIISTIIYFMLVGKIVPFMSIRYFLIIVPLIHIVLVYILKFVMETLVKKEILRISMVVIIILGYMLISLTVAEKNEFLYKGSNNMYKEIEKTGVKDYIYYYNNFYEVNSDITRYIKDVNVYFADINKISENNSNEKETGIAEIRKKDKINIFLYNTHLDKIDEILQKLNKEYKVIKETKNFYRKSVYNIKIISE